MSAPFHENGREKLRLDNHQLYRRVTHLVSLRWHWSCIALDVGVYDVQALCQWVLDYKEPRKLPMVRTRVLNVPVRRTTAPVSQQFIAWRRQRAGVAKARELADQ